MIFRIADLHLEAEINKYATSINYHKMYAYFAISAVSFVIICLFLIRIKQEENNPALKVLEEKERAEEDPYKRVYRIRRLSRILKEPSSYDPTLLVGMKLNKRCNDKPIHKVTEDLLLSAKEVTQRELKKYFNESEESAIGAILEMNHHLSLSHSISDHEIVEEPHTISSPSESNSQS